MTDLRRFIIGTAAWGPKPYGVNKQRVPAKMALDIARRAIDHGCGYFHTKVAYGVSRVLLSQVEDLGGCVFNSDDVRDTYGLADAKAVNPRLAVCVEFNPLRQFVVRGLGDRPGLWVRSIFMQGILAGSIPQAWAFSCLPLLEIMEKYHPHATIREVCVWLALASPAEKIMVGINHPGELDDLMMAVDAMPPDFRFDDYANACLGDIPETDPRAW
jgi:hypothetical protein